MVNTQSKNYEVEGNIGLFILFIIMSIILLFIFGLITPFLITFDAEIYHAGETVLDTVNQSSLPPHAQEAVNSSLDSISSQIDILSSFFQYGWMIIIFIILMVLFLRSRTLVEEERRLP